MLISHKNSAQLNKYLEKKSNLVLLKAQKKTFLLFKTVFFFSPLKPIFKLDRA